MTDKTPIIDDHEDWHSLDPEIVLKDLRVAENGLTTEEAAKRRLVGNVQAAHGPQCDNFREMLRRAAGDDLGFLAQGDVDAVGVGCGANRNLGRAAGAGVHLVDAPVADVVAVHVAHQHRIYPSQARIVGAGDGASGVEQQPGAVRIFEQHGPVEAWGWPEMKMDFPVAGAVNIHQLKEGSKAQFLVKKLDSGGIQIINMAGSR